MASVSPKKGWSPHVSALKRRQRKSSGDPSTIIGSLNMLDMDMDSDDDIFLNNNKTKRGVSPKRKMRGVRKGTKKPVKKVLSLSPERKNTSSQDDIPPVIQEKLAIISDPATPMRERIQLELEMRKIPKEEQYLAEFKHSFDRKKYLSVVEKRGKEEEEQLQKNLREEDSRVAQEEEKRAKAKLAEIEEEIAKHDRDEKLRDDIALHQQQIIAKDTEQVRKNAEKMLVRVTERGAMAEMEEKERKARIEEFRETNGKDLTHVEKVLAEAIMDQREIAN